MPQINTRLRQKIDTESNWNKATNFIPLDGEIIIYKADINHPYERIKIGDGETTVINLAFVNSIDTNLTQAGQAADAKAVGDAIGNKVDKVMGMGLSSNDYTTEEKEKLAGIEEVIDYKIANNAVLETIMTDIVNGYEYIVRMENGNLVSFPAAINYEITQYPSKTTYHVGEAVDLSGLIYTVYCSDGSKRDVTKYVKPLPSVITKNTTMILLAYYERGKSYAMVFPISVETEITDPAT